MERRRLQKSRDDLIRLLAELQADTDNIKRLVITPFEDKLLARVEYSSGKKKGQTALKAVLDFPILGGEQALPIFSRVEYDETTGSIQQRMPVKYLFSENRPRSHSHIHGQEPRTRRSRRYPLSDPKYKEKSRRSRRTGRSRPKTKQDWERAEKAGDLDFLKLK